MANTKIQIRRSTATATPTGGSLSTGELAHSYSSNVLFIGTSDGSGILPVGGSFYVDKTNTALNIASAAFDAANSAGTSAAVGAAYDQANSAQTIAVAVFTQSNSVAGAVTTANNIAIAAFNQANTSETIAIASFTQGNNLSGAVTTANNIAIAAFGKANDAQTIAVSAFTSSNGKLNTTGGTITGDLAISGNLTITGNTVFKDVETFKVSDPLIYLAANNVGADIVDIGFIGIYANSTGSNVYTGFFRNSQDKEYYLFSDYDQEPVDNNINPAGNNFTISVLNADIKTNNLVLNGTNTTLWITSAFDKANAANYFAFLVNSNTTAAFNQANTATTIGSAAFTQANNVGSALNTANTNITAAFNQANTSQTIAVAAFTQANNVAGAVTTANTIASAAFNKANSAAETVNMANASGTLAISNGGTNQTSFTNGQLILFNGTSLTSRANGGIAGTFGNTSHVPVFTTDAYGFVTAVTNTSISISASQISSGTLPVERGGTGNTTFTSKGILFGNGTGAVLVTAAGTEGKVLQADDTGTPVFSDLDGGSF
jgi:hypothetical protein